MYATFSLQKHFNCLRKRTLRFERRRLVKGVAAAPAPPPAGNDNTWDKQNNKGISGKKQEHKRVLGMRLAAFPGCRLWRPRGRRYAVIPSTSFEPKKFCSLANELFQGKSSAQAHRPHRGWAGTYGTLIFGVLLYKLICFYYICSFDMKMIYSWY